MKIIKFNCLKKINSCCGFHEKNIFQNEIKAEVDLVFAQKIYHLKRTEEGFKNSAVICRFFCLPKLSFFVDNLRKICYN